MNTVEIDDNNLLSFDWGMIARRLIPDSLGCVTKITKVKEDGFFVETKSHFSSGRYICAKAAMSPFGKLELGGTFQYKCNCGQKEIEVKVIFSRKADNELGRFICVCSTCQQEHLINIETSK